MKNLIKKKSLIVFLIGIFSMTTIEAIEIAERNNIDNAEKELLARAIYGEASDQGDEGMEAVGHVILNRVKGKDWYGNTITDVILKDKQFTVFNDQKSANYKRMMGATEDDEVYQQALQIAENLILGNLDDNTGGATHYYNPDDASPDWADDPLMTKLKKIGDHTFLLEA